MHIADPICPLMLKARQGLMPVERAEETDETVVYRLQEVYFTKV